MKTKTKFDSKPWMIRREKIIEAIIDSYGSDFFRKECGSILEVGCGAAPMSLFFAEKYPRINITCSDAKEENLKEIKKRNPDIKVITADLDYCWPFQPEYDLIIHSGVLYHLHKPHTALRWACKKIKKHLFLETEWFDSDDPNAMMCMVDEFEDIYNGAKNLVGCRPSMGMLERVLSEEEVVYERIMRKKYNSKYCIYTNEVEGTNKISVMGKEYRGMWRIENDNRT